MTVTCCPTALSACTVLTLPGPLTQIVKRSLIIENNNREPVAFKVKTTAPKQYCVRPNQGRVEPGEKVEVQSEWKVLPRLTQSRPPAARRRPSPACKVQGQVPCPVGIHPCQRGFGFAIALAAGACEFVILSGADIPSGTRLSATTRQRLRSRRSAAPTLRPKTALVTPTAFQRRTRTSRRQSSTAGSTSR